MRIAFLNPQGNFDSADSNWTMHPDFGGQLVYVKELAIALADKGHKVDIITRAYKDDKYPAFYHKFDYYPESVGVRIVRIPCGGDAFLRKEDLWPHLIEWTENIKVFFRKEKYVPDFIAGHYADGGISAAILAKALKIPFSFTAHSLGAQKMDKLLAKGAKKDALETEYHFSERIEAERTSIKYADVIFVSTLQEKDEQYHHILYEDATKKNQNSFVIAPPGANTRVFSDKETPDDIVFFKHFSSIESRDIDKDRINLSYLVMASRLDAKKNHIGVLKAYASDKELQAKSNLAISLRGIPDAFEDYSSASISEREILDSIMDVINENDLRGKVLLISIDSQKELASFYRFAAKKSSLFVLASLYEPFGLAPIEAMCTGLAAVVTKNGGPSSIMEEDNARYGILVDPVNSQSIAKGCLEALNNYEYFRKAGKNRVLEKYTWRVTADKYLYGFNIAKAKEIHPIAVSKNN